MPLTSEQQQLNLLLSGVSCSCAQFVVHPSETTMVRQQLTPKGTKIPSMISTFRRILEKEAVAGIYRGFTAATLREMSYSTLRFGLYEPLRDLMHDDPSTNAAMLGKEFAGIVRVAKRMFAGCVAGGIASAIASPTDLLKVRMQSDTTLPHPKFVTIVRSVASQSGGPIRPFYEGVSATITRAVVLGATKMAVYNEVKDYLKRSCSASDPVLRPSSLQLMIPCSYGWIDTDFKKYGHTQSPSNTDRLALVFNSAAVTGLAVTMTTSAFTNAKTHIMANPGKYRGMFHCLVSIVQSYGPAGLYRGFAAQWLRYGPYATVQFLVWENLRYLTGIPGL